MHTIANYLCVHVQTVGLARCYKSKLKAVLDGVQHLRESGLDPAVLSVHCLELFINAILLDLLVGKPSVALRHFDQARAAVSTEGNASSSFRGVHYNYNNVRHFLSCCIPLCGSILCPYYCFCEAMCPH